VSCKDYDHECVEEHVLDGKNMFAVLSGILFFFVSCMMCYEHECVEA
jgi:hypothetical protein